MKKLLSKTYAWLSLIRLPNLFTVPGDCVVGYLLSGGFYFNKPFILLIISSISYYIFGLITNDIRDLPEDRQDNPERPLPSGAIKIAHARTAAAMFLFSGVLCGFLSSLTSGMVGLLLLLAIVLYNFVFKSNPVIAPILMSSCRLLNVLLGASLSQINLISPAMLILLHFSVLYFTFVFGISVAARNEKSSDILSFISGTVLISFSTFLLFLYSLFKFVRILNYTGHFPPAFWSGIAAMLILFVILLGFMANRFIKGNRDISSSIGRLICGMTLFQAVYLSS
nr:UbiA family prenyltransferase [Victivallales bacterium]